MQTFTGCSNGGTVDTKDLKSFGYCSCAGSSPASSTTTGRDTLSVSLPVVVHGGTHAIVYRSGVLPVALSVGFAQSATFDRTDNTDAYLVHHVEWHGHENEGHNIGRRDYRSHNADG